MRLDNNYLRLLHQVLHEILLPGTRTPGVLMYEVASLTNLVVVEEYAKPNMLHRFLLLGLKSPQPFFVVPMEMLI